MRLQAARLSIVAVTALVPACGGGGGAPSVAPSSPAATQPALDAPTRQALDAMLSQLETKIAWFLSNEQASLPMNPRIEAWIQAKIAMPGPEPRGPDPGGQALRDRRRQPLEGRHGSDRRGHSHREHAVRGHRDGAAGRADAADPGGNTGWLALIDVYQLLGRDPMGREYKAIAR